MHLGRCCAVGVILILVSSGHAGVLAGPIVNPANGHTYTLLTTNSWTASEAEAVALGGHLATIRNQTENAWVLATFSPFLQDNTGNAIWIGLNDAANEGQFVWVSGEPVTYTNWGQGEPNNDAFFGGEDHTLLMVHDYNVLHPGDWNDANDTAVDRKFGVVEILPEPSSLATVAAIATLLARRRGSSRK